jgi:hypothetical protein
MIKRLYVSLSRWKRSQMRIIESSRKCYSGVGIYQFGQDRPHAKFVTKRTKPSKSTSRNLTYKTNGLPLAFFAFIIYLMINLVSRLPLQLPFNCVACPYCSFIITKTSLSWLLKTGFHMYEQFQLYCYIEQSRIIVYLIDEYRDSSNRKQNSKTKVYKNLDKLV